MSDRTDTPSPTRHRRRGTELENALLDAAWEELVAVGFGGLTMESVAARARTGVAVLYRRWANKSDLVIATIARYGVTHPIEAPDTGSLRDDMLALLTSLNASRTSLIAVVRRDLRRPTRRERADAPRRSATSSSARDPRWSDAIFRRAHERGEIDLTRVSPDILKLPSDLMRHDLLMHLSPVSPERITAIVDDIFLPLAIASRR